MASLPGAIFDEYSSLNNAEKVLAVSFLGAQTSFAQTVIAPPAGRVQGSAGNDLFLVGSAATVIQEASGGGKDVVVSSASRTLEANLEALLLTGSGNLSGTGNTLDNLIIGTSGHNALSGGTGNDLLLGGAGRDTLDGGTGNDTLSGGIGEDRLLGGTGNDMLQGDEGNDTLDGGTGEDSLDGGAGDDLLSGGTGNDTLQGGDGHDLLQGGSGSDRLESGAGNDTLTGGTGADMFYFGDGTGATTITDFKSREDVILIESHINGSGIVTAQDVLLTLGHDASGDATVNLGGKIVILDGIKESDVTAAFFQIE